MVEKNNEEKTILVNTENHRALFDLKMDNKLKSINDSVSFLLKRIEELMKQLEEKNSEIEELKKNAL